MSLSLVPLISSERSKGNSTFLKNKITAAFKISVVIGVGASAGLWAIIRPTNTMLFENDFGSSVLGVLSFVILFSSIISTIVAIMQGVGRFLFPALVIAASFPIKYGLNMLLVPLLGTMGAAVSTIITLAVVSLILAWKLTRMIKITLFPLRFVIAIVIAALGMIVIFKRLFICDQSSVWTAFR